MIKGGSRRARRNSNLGPGAGYSTVGGATLFFAPLTTNLLPYSQGSGTPTYSRATAAYVQDHEGVMRQVQSGEARFWGARRVRNMISDSQTLTSANWTLNNATRVGGQTDPFNGTTAILLSADATVGAHRIFCTAVFGGSLVDGNILVTSVYAKAGTVNRFQIAPSTNLNAAAPCVNFSLVGSGAVLNSTAGVVASGITALSNGWYRCWCAFQLASPVAATTCIAHFINSDSAGWGPSYSASTSDNFYLAMAQTEDATGQSVRTPSKYVSTGVLSAPYQGTGVDGVQCFDTVRLHTQNIANYSEALDNGAQWQCVDMTVVAASGVLAPNGSQAFQLADNANATSHRTTLISTAVIAGGTTWKFSAYVKQSTGNTVVLRLIDNAFANGSQVRVSSISGMAFTLANSGLGIGSATMVDVGNGWRLVTLTVAFPISSVASLPFVLFYTGPDANPYSGTGTGPLVAAPSVRLATASISDLYVPAGAAAVGPTDTGSTAMIPSTTLLGYLSEDAGTQLVTPTASIRGLNDGSWVASGGTSTVAKTSTGIDGVANSATRVTATGANAVLMQAAPVTAAGNYVSSFYIRRVTGTGNIDITVDGGTTWSTISGSINSATYTRVQVTGNLALNTARIGIRIVTSGDAVDVDFAQLESGTGATSPLATAGSSVRNADNLLYPAANNCNEALGSAYLEATRFTDVAPTSARLLAFVGAASASPLTIGSSGQLQSADGTNFPAVPTALALGTTYKCGVAWGGATQSLARGAPSANSSLGTAFDGGFGGTLSSISVGSIGGTLQSAGCLRNVRIYSQKLSDAQLTAMVA